MQGDTENVRVGFIGLGLMGYPMAANLAGAGYDLAVFNRSQKKSERLAEQTGCAVASSVAELADRDFVVTMLPGPPEVEGIIGEALIPSIKDGAIIADMSTSSPVLARRLCERGDARGVYLLDAPVSGGDVGAADGTLSIMVGGEEEVFRRTKPLFDAMGETVTHVGESGSGQIVKAANQAVVAVTIQAVSEALTLARCAGVDSQRVLDVLGGGTAANSVMKVKRGKFLSGEFEPGGRVAFQYKDLGLVLNAAREAGVVMPATAVCDQLYAALMAREMGGLDHTALIRTIENLSGESG